MKDDENIFDDDDDDALDFIIYDEVTREKQGDQDKSGKAGCLGPVALVVFPVAWIGYWICKNTQQKDYLSGVARICNGNGVDQREGRLGAGICPCV